MKTKDEKWLAEQVEKFAGGQKAELPAGLTHVSNGLQQAMRETQPRAGFVNQLAGQLQERQATSRQPRTGGPGYWLWRLLAGAAGVAAVIVFALFVSGLFSQPPVEPAITGQQTALPSIILQGETGPFAGMEFRLEGPLPTRPETLALYEAEVGPLPETAEAVAELARSLGMDDATVYRTGGGWFAEDEAGRRLTVDLAPIRFPIIYQARAEQPAGEQEPAAPEAAARAVAFLEAAGLLPAAYEVRERPADSGPGRTRVQIIPILDGHPVHYGASELVVDPVAGVGEAWIQPLRFVATGESVTARPGQEAFAEALQSGATMNAFQLDPVELAVETVYPSFAEAEAGDDVRLLGFVRHLQPAGGGPLQIRLAQDPSGENAFFLNGARAEEIPDGQLVEVSGTLAQRLPGGRWAVTMGDWAAIHGDWQSPTSDNQHMDCRTGVLQLEAGDLFFLTDEGRTPYQLANPPAVAGGQRARVCAIFRDTPYPLPWLVMNIPPADEQMPAFGPLSGAPAEAAEVVEVTRVIVDESGDGRPTQAPRPTPPPDRVGYVTERVEADGRVFTETLTLPLGSTVSPIEGGQQGEVTGRVGGSDVETPLLTSEPAATQAAGSNTLIIDWAVLGYTFSSGRAGVDGEQTLQPTWLFYGQSGDGLTHFVMQVPAVEEGTEGGNGR